MLIKMTVKEMAVLALALQERSDETREDSEKIVPLETELRNGFFIGDLVICRALDEWAGVGKVFEVSGFCDDYSDNAVVSDGARTFVVSTRELLHIAPGANLVVGWSQHAKV